MASNNLIQIKRTSVSGRAPTTTTLPNPGELALNMADGILYSGNGSVVFEIGANNTNVNVSNKLNVGNNTVNTTITSTNVNTSAINISLATGGSIAFNGTSAYISGTVTDSPGTSTGGAGVGDFTMEAFVRPSQLAGSGTPGVLSLMDGTGTDTGFWLYVNSTGWGVRNNTGNIITYNTPPSLNNWYHVALVRDSGTLTLYINGVARATTSTNYTFSDLTFVAGAFNSTYFNGYISNIRYSWASVVYSSNFTPPTLPLTVVSGTELLLIQRTAGTYLTDTSGYNTTITAYGSPSYNAVSPFTSGGYTTANISGFYTSGNISAAALTIGSSTTNTQITSTSLITKGITANGTSGSAGQVLAANSTGGIYWSTGGTGYTGSKGYTGSFGTTGYTGSKGDTGTGYWGSVGYTGSAGTDGIIGYWGSVGYTGSRGTNGTNGVDGYWGSVGYTGSKGDTGTGYTGSIGSVGYTGSHGTNGTNGTNGIDGYWGSVGYTGSRGTTGYTGSIGTTGYTGSKGDTGTGYWGSVGYTGSQGPQGNPGSNGSQGDPGATGYTGSQGQGFSPQGTWTGTTHGYYLVGDIVTYNGSTYVCINNVYGNTPPDSDASWSLYAAKGDVGYTGSQGLPGSFGGAAFDYTFNANTNNTDPGNGGIKLSNTDFTYATHLYINENADNFVSTYNFLQTIDDSTSAIKGHFTVTEKANTDNFSLFSIVGNHSHYTNYFDVPVSYLSGNTSLTNKLDIIVTFARTGDIGDTGYTGSQGIVGYSGSRAESTFANGQSIIVQDLTVNGTFTANGYLGSVGQVLAANSTGGIYWTNDQTSTSLTTYIITAGTLNSDFVNIGVGHLSVGNSTVNSVVSNTGFRASNTTSNIVLTLTDFRVPVGNTGQRPANTTTGYIRFNTDTTDLEYASNSTKWYSITTQETLTSNNINITNIITVGNTSVNTIVTNRSLTTNTANVNVLNATGNVVIYGNTAVFKVPIGTTAQRPSPADTGYIRFNTDTTDLEYAANSSTWYSITTQETLTSNNVNITNQLIIGNTTNGGTYALISNNYLKIANAISNVVFSLTDFRVPVGNTAQRPANAAVGYIRFNTDNTDLEYAASSTKWYSITTQETLTSNNINITNIVSIGNSTVNTVITSRSLTTNTANVYVLNISGNTILSGNTAAFKIPVGTTAQRPSPADTGYIRFNTTTTDLEYAANSSTWYSITTQETLTSNNINITNLINIGNSTVNTIITSSNVSTKYLVANISIAVGNSTTNSISNTSGYFVYGTGATLLANTSTVNINLATGGSIAFNGSSAYISGTVTNAPGTSTGGAGIGDFSIEAFVQPSQLAGGGATPGVITLMNGTGTDTGFWIYVNNAGWGVRNNSGNIITYGTPPSATNWYHVALVRDSGTLTLYINGKSAGSTSTNYTFSDTTFKAGEFNSTYFNGYISNIRYSWATVTYTGDFTPPRLPLTTISGSGGTGTQLLLVQSNADSYLIDTNTNYTGRTITGTATSYNTRSPFTGYNYTTANHAGFFTSGVVNATTLSVGTDFTVNNSQIVISSVNLIANGYQGTASQVLTSNSTGGAYWGPGSVGYTGSRGNTGYTGSAGTNGTAGTTGYTGSAGVGYTGSVGSTGGTGYTGSQGAGYTGSVGSVGYSGSVGTIGYTGSAGSGSGGASVTVSATAPGSPTAGNLWWNTENGTLYIYYDDGDSSQWVAAIPTTGTSAGIGTITETVYTITDGASVDINPSNGGIQLWTLGASRTPTATNFGSGKYVLLMINDGTAYTVTWSSVPVTWLGGSAPTLATTGYTFIELWKVGSTIYGSLIGSA